VDPWIAQHAAAIATRAERELEALVAISTPSGDVHGADEAAALVAALAPDEAAIERVECSSPDHAADLLIRLTGTGSRRLLLLGHLDTVVAHEEHRPLTREGEQLLGSGTIDMKGGDVLALGLLRALATRTSDFAEAALLLVCDEEWRVGPFAHVPRFEGFDACLCFEAGQLADDDEAVVVRRKAAGTLRVTAHGRSAHSGSAPDKGINALLALASAAQAVAGSQDPQGPQRLTAVPTVLHAGDAFNVVPGIGQLVCDLRADSLDAFEGVLRALPAELGGARLEARLAASVRGPRARAPGHRGGPRRRQRRGPLRGRDPLHRRRSRAPRRRRARPPRIRPGLVAEAARRGRVGRGGCRLACLTGGRSERPYGEFLKEATKPPIYPLDCPGRFDQPNLCRATTESGGPSSHLGGMGRIVAMRAT
jgi:glutamate carboxypeptidase